MNECKTIVIDENGAVCNEKKDSLYCPQGRTESHSYPCTSQCAWFSMDKHNIVRCQATVLGTAAGAPS